MTQSKTKSRTFRRVKKRTPKGVVTHYIKKRPKKARCGGCGTVLHAIKHKTPKALNKLPKSQKRPERPFGGALCSRCARADIKARARK